MNQMHIFKTKLMNNIIYYELKEELSKSYFAYLNVHTVLVHDIILSGNVRRTSS